MSLELELEAARDAAQNLAGNGEQVAAVMASEPGLAARVYLIAFGTDEEHSYLALGADLSPVHDHRLVREAVVMLALAFLVRLQLWLFGWPGTAWTDLLRVDVLNCMGLALAVMSVMAVFRTA